MSESKIEVTISHDGEYCGECRFLGKGILNGYYQCKEYGNVDLWSRSDKVKRCDACLEKAVPVEVEREEK